MAAPQNFRPTVRVPACPCPGLASSTKHGSHNSLDRTRQPHQCSTANHDSNSSWPIQLASRPVPIAALQIGNARAYWAPASDACIDFRLSNDSEASKIRQPADRKASPVRETQTARCCTDISLADHTVRPSLWKRGFSQLLLACRPLRGCSDAAAKATTRRQVFEAEGGEPGGYALIVPEYWFDVWDT